MEGLATGPVRSDGRFCKEDFGQRMIQLSLDGVARGGLKILCLGSHPDDIEIGCGEQYVTVPVSMT